MHPFRLPSLLSFAAVICAAVIASPHLRAADDPAPALLATINSVIDLTLGQSPVAIQERLSSIRARMDDSFATSVIVQRAFGRNWPRLTPAQQTEAIDLLGRLIIRTYAVQLSSGERPVITVTASREIAQDRHEVVSTVVHHGGTVNVVYRLGRIDGRWQVYDVLAEGISVVGNYRQQFDDHFQKASAGELLELLRRRLAVVPAREKAGT